MASLFKVVLTVSSGVLFVLTAVVFIRTFTFSVRADVVPPCDPKDGDFIEATEHVIGRFQKVLRCQSVSRGRSDYNRGELLKIQNIIKSEFPAIHSSPLVTLEVVNNYSMLYTVKGDNPSLTPYLLASHMDVVPAEPEKWEVPPFSGDIKDGFIYGRGTIDVKQSLMSIMESLEFLLKRGFAVHRSFYIALGHDEEVAGFDGAASLAQRLRQKGVTSLEFILDEGLTVTDGIVPGLDIPAALIGTSEKGQVIMRLSVEGKASHSSMPPRESCIGILAGAVHRLESIGHPSMFGRGPEKDMFEHLAPQLHFIHRVAMSNLWLFTPLVSWALSRSPTTNAIVRTVTSITRFNAGIKDNVMPPEAVAIVNHRIHPAQTVQEVLDYDRTLISDDRVKMEVIYKMEAHPMSPCGPDDFGYQTVKNSIQQVWQNAVIAPATMIGNTDTNHYRKLTSNIYRFSPTYMYPSDVARFHGDNERISVKNYEQAINFYLHLIQHSNKQSLQPHHQHAEL